MLFDRNIAPETYAAIRFGWGLPLRGGPTGPEAILQRLSGPDRVIEAHPMLSFQETVDLTNGIRNARKNSMMDPRAAVKAARAEQNYALTRTLKDEFLRVVETDDPFRERLMAFWTNHFAARASGYTLRTGHAGYAAEAIRPHLNGRFAEMLKAVARHPFMLFYLDQRESVGPNSDFGIRRGRGLNENYARELIELHTMGTEADYSQTDVRQMAELLTGLTASLKRGFEFRTDWAEPGAEQVLEHSYGGGAPGLDDIDAMLDDLSVHPATAKHISQKLAKHFISDVPDPDLVSHMAAGYLAADGDLMALYAAMLEHPAAWRDFGAKVKTPLELMLSAIRALGFRAADIDPIQHGQFRKLVGRPLMQMGMRYAEPPGPDGWPDEAATWINAHGIAARLNWIIRLTNTLRKRTPDPRGLVEQALGDASGPALRFAAHGAETRAEGVMLIFASAEFNRR